MCTLWSFVTGVHDYHAPWSTGNRSAPVSQLCGVEPGCDLQPLRTSRRCRADAFVGPSPSSSLAFVFLAFQLFTRLGEGVDLAGEVFAEKPRSWGKDIAGRTKCCITFIRVGQLPHSRPGCC